MTENIHPSLQSLAIEINSLTPDPRNARAHSPRNLDAIAESLRVHGQRKPIVVQRSGDDLVVRAGNGTMEAATTRLGWEYLAAVVVDESDDEAIAFAIRDNRTAELAEWDLEALADGLHHLVDVGVEMESLGFEAFEYEPLLDVGDWSPKEVGSGGSTKSAPSHETVKFTVEEWQELGELLGRFPSSASILSVLREKAGT